MKKVTAGRDYLNDLAPEFARLNDDVLFGEVWSNDNNLSLKQRSMITISSLIGSGIFDQSLEGHIQTGKENGITKKEIVDIITHLAFYAGWPKAWSAFSIVSEVYKDDNENLQSTFGLGDKLDNPNFNGNVYVKKIFGFDKPMIMDNVTFEPGCRNNWHKHMAGQTLLVTDGIGWYQEEGKKAQKLKPGDIVNIPANVKHWHGASANSHFVHLAIEDYTKGAPIWLEALSDEEYERLED